MRKEASKQEKCLQIHYLYVVSYFSFLKITIIILIIYLYFNKNYLRLPLFSSSSFDLPLSAAKVRFSFSKIKININIIYINFLWRVAIIVAAVIHCLSFDLSLQFFPPRKYSSSCELQLMMQASTKKTSSSIYIICRLVSYFCFFVFRFLPSTFFLCLLQTLVFPIFPLFFLCCMVPVPLLFSFCLFQQFGLDLDFQFDMICCCQFLVAGK